jgi:hypothetical protein
MRNVKSQKTHLQNTGTRFLPFYTSLNVQNSTFHDYAPKFKTCLKSPQRNESDLNSKPHYKNNVSKSQRLFENEEKEDGNVFSCPEGTFLLQVRAYTDTFWREVKYTLPMDELLSKEHSVFLEKASLRQLRLTRYLDFSRNPDVCCSLVLLQVS